MFEAFGSGQWVRMHNVQGELTTSLGHTYQRHAYIIRSALYTLLSYASVQ